MNIISDLYNNKKNYFLSTKDEVTIRCGGSEGGRFYGMIEIHLSADFVVINKTVSDSIISAPVLLPERYSHNTIEYKLTLQLIREVREYLANPINRIYQDKNRTRLLANTQNLLPQNENQNNPVVEEFK